MARIDQDFAKRLRRLREHAGWTQEKLAERAGLSRNYIGLLELSRREPSLSTLLSLSKALTVSLDELAGAGIRIAESEAVYKTSPRSAAQILETLQKFHPSDRDVIADIIDSCLKLKPVFYNFDAREK